MPTEPILQIGVGGVLALLIIREVLRFLKQRQPASGAVSAGAQSPEYWQAEQRKAITDVVVSIVVPILSNQNAILNELRVSQTEMNKNMAIMLDRLIQGQRG